MHFLAFLILGLIAGAIAKLILPGKQGGGWLITMILGVVGALLGGFIANAVFSVDTAGTFSLPSILFAVLGALIVLVIYGAVTKRGSRV
ncbi:GlsB/YeaQ/YmgE family stress response membrane protein [Arthrobacter sp. Br18]|uniref:GlsB/YeaQ/YmgE family stress response membrane protein n=1 Tax=Arthrobacter sp. Br18 TaxID=1312954 RepID=UPI00047AE158|nr:GlsB/YeaQ/YmgE family stress response membrane protein [Arthrobacter sp. Br18]